MRPYNRILPFSLVWPLILALIILRMNFGCASKQRSGIEEGNTTSMNDKSSADSVQKQVVTELDGDELKKTMDYPYLKVRFDQNDTEVEMVLDPESTNLALDLVRGAGGDVEIIYGDSTYSDKEGKTLPDDLITGLKKNRGNGENLTDDIIRDIQMAQKFFYEKRYEQALKVLKASLEKKPTATAYSLGGSIYFVNGEIKEAVKAWQNALKVDPDLDDVRELVERYKK